MDRIKYFRPNRRNEFENSTFGNKPPSFSNPRDFDNQYQQLYNVEEDYEPPREREETKDNRTFSPIMSNISRDYYQTIGVPGFKVDLYSRSNYHSEYKSHRLSKEANQNISVNSDANMEKLIEEIEGLRRENSNLRSYATQLNQDRSREFRHYPSNIQLLRKSAEIEPLDTNRSHSLPTVRRNPSERSDSHLDFQSKDKAIMVDTFDDFYVREEYNQRIEEMLNEKEQMQSRLNELLQERDSQQRVQQQHVREFELQRNQIKELGQKMKVKIR